MPKNPNRVTENDVAFAIIQVAKTSPLHIATFARCRKEVPSYLRLGAADLAQSPTRPNESMWEQQIRNIKSHSNEPGNYIYEGFLTHLPNMGYKATATGLTRTHP
jgi:hypothetical protein